jgi:hypothetical protein
MTLQLKNFFLILFLFFLITQVSGQEEQLKDSTVYSVGENSGIKKHARDLKNSLLVNVTNPLISPSFFTLTYERILPKNQSFTVSIGSFSIPRFLSLNTDSLGIKTNKSDKGFHFSGDYRFYLDKLNRYDAPRGIYIGPYYAYNQLQRGTIWNYEGEHFNGEVNSDLRFNIHTIGFQLGYQFVFWNRLAVDLILLGPGYGSYTAKVNLNTTLSPEQEMEFFQKLNEYLQDNIPGFEWVIKPGEFNRKGSFNTWTLGYRYTIKVGFRF